MTNVDLLKLLCIAGRAKLMTRLQLTEDCFNAHCNAERGAADLANDIKDDMIIEAI